MRAPPPLFTALAVALLVPGCFLDRSALDGPPADGGQPPDMDAAGVDAFVPPEDDAGSPDTGTPCVPTSGVDMCDGTDDDCNRDTADGSGEEMFGAPCDGGDADDCDEGMWMCEGTGLRCSDLSADNVEGCDGENDDCDMFVDEEAGCPCPVETFGGHGYLFCETGETWQNASDACPPGYDLVRIDDGPEQAFVVEVVAATSANDWWLGGSGGADGMWRWLVGDDLIPRTGGSGFSNWDSGEPNTTGECLEIESDQTGPSGPGRWTDQSCGTSQPYVCESVPAP